MCMVFYHSENCCFSRKWLGLREHNDLCSAYWSKSLDQRIVTSLSQFLTSPRKGMWLSSFDQQEGISAGQRKLSEVVQVVQDGARSPNSKSVIF